MLLYVNTVITLAYKILVRDGITKFLMYPVYSRCITANFFCTLNQQLASTYYQIKSRFSKYILTRLIAECMSNYHVCPLKCIVNTLDSENIFFKETAYTKVHFYIRPKRIEQTSYS